jgi:hypothetical protein
MGDCLQQPAMHGTALQQSAGSQIECERKHQEQVADLRDGRIGHQQLQALLAQGHNTACNYRQRPERAKQLRGRKGNHARHDVKPQAHDKKPGTLDHQGRQYRACRCRGTRVRRRQPEVQGKQCGLGQQANGHQGQHRPGDRLRAHSSSQQCDVQSAIGTVEQDRAQQVEHRSRQRKQQIAQRGAQGVTATVQADQRHSGKCQQLQRDVQSEQISADKYQIERAPHSEQQQPESKGSAAFLLSGG